MFPQHHESTFVSGSVNTKYNVENDGTIISALIEQVERLTPLSADAGTVLTGIRQSLELTNVEQGHSSSLLCSGASSPVNFAYPTCTPHVERDCQSDVKRLIENMASSASGDIPYHFLDLIELMKTCNRSDLDALKILYVQPIWVDEKSTMEKHTFFWMLWHILALNLQWTLLLILLQIIQALS
jgi:hypothetical protein